MRPVSLILAAICATPTAAQSWRIGDHSYHIVARDLDQRTSDGRAAMLARVERAAAKLCEHEPVTVDRRACVTATIDGAARRSPPLRLALAERDATALAKR